METSKENRLSGDFDEPAWSKPLLGVAPGDDPLFLEFREAVDARHFLPEEVFNLHFPENSASGSELAVICWILPQTDRTREENRRQKKSPAERWLRNKRMGKAFNDILGRFVVSWLSEMGVDGVAPVLSPPYGRFFSPRFGLASSWSERHIAYACGLGTFGLSEGLITPAGKAVRTGSAVVRAKTGPAVRPYSDIHEYCLFYRDGSCGACLARCPSGSLRKDGAVTRLFARNTSTGSWGPMRRENTDWPLPMPAGFARWESPVRRGYR